MGNGTWIKKLTIDATSNNIQNIELKNLVIKELQFYANGHYIIACSVEDCCIVKDNTWHGVVIQGDGTTNGWMDSLHFTRCYFDIIGTNTSWGGATWVNCQFITEIYFSDCTFDIGQVGMSVFKFRGDGAADSVFVLNPRIYCAFAGNIIDMDGRTGAFDIGLKWFQWTGGRVESPANVTILKMLTSATDTNLVLDISHVSFQPGSPYYTIIGDVNDSISWVGTKPMLFSITQCTFRYGQWTWGTLPLCVRVQLIFENNAVLNPIGLAATPFETTAWDTIRPTGDTDHPTSGNNYEVEVTDILFNCTGGTDVNITITDSAGNVMLMDETTLFWQYVPRGYYVKVTYSDVPTVKIYFE
jgi:hypothetical protein